MQIHPTFFLVSLCIGSMAMTPLETDSSQQTRKRQRSPSFELDAASLKVAFHQNCIPKPGSIPHVECGEDGIASAVFEDKAVFAVNDGLGGYQASHGSGFLADGIAKKLIDLYPVQNHLNPFSQIIGSYQAATPLPENSSGATTLAYGIIDMKSGQLISVNLGDCAIMVIRDHRFVKTKTVQYSFNMPAKVEYDASMNITENLASAAKYLRHSAVQSFKLAPGDIIIAASDGLWDNLFDEEVRELTKVTMDKISAKAPSAPSEKRSKVISSVLAKVAASAAQGKTRETIQRPFYRALDEFIKKCVDFPETCDNMADRFVLNYQTQGNPSNYKYGSLGGKIDDVSVIVGIVESGESKRVLNGAAASETPDPEETAHSAIRRR